MRVLTSKPRWLHAASLLLCFGWAASAATSPVYENRAIVSNPQIDAAVVLNRGTMNINSGDQPFDTQGTLSTTNFVGGIITGSGGFRFDLVDTNGLRRSAANWVNQGTISFSSGFGGTLFFGTGGSGLSLNPTAWVLVHATNIQNRGGITVDPNGLIRLTGGNVVLARAGIRAGYDPSDPITPSTDFPPYYDNEQGVSDNYGGVGLNNQLDPGAGGGLNLNLLTGRSPSSGRHEVLINPALTNSVTVPTFTQLTNTFAVTNTLSPTNWVVQVVYINTNTTDTALTVGVRFAPPRDPSVDGGVMPMIQFAYQDVDTITADTYTNYVYVLDTLGAITNSVLLTNITTVGTGREQQKPSNFIITRSPPQEWASGTGTNAAYIPDLIYNSGLASDTVTNWYSGYSFNVGESATTTSFGGLFGLGRFGGLGGFGSGEIAAYSHPTNQPGRVEITSDRLDLSLSRFRTEGLLSLKTKELVGTPPYKLDSSKVSMDVGLPQGTLTVSNLIQPTVRRFNGRVNLYSTIWTNQAFVPGPDPADPTLTVTNTIEIRYHALLVDHQFNTIVPVDTLNFAARAPRVVLQDRVSVTESLVFDSPDIELRAPVILGTNQITARTFPTVVTLTNANRLTSQVGVSLGSTTRPIPTLVNSGTVSGSVVDLTAGSLAHSGDISSTVGDIGLTAKEMKFEKAKVTARGNLLIQADDLKLTGTALQAGYEARNPQTGNTNYFLGQVRLSVGTRLTDGGPTASNTITVYDGFHLLTTPAEGDLLGTTVTSKVARFAESVHTWAGRDLGAVPEGFVNNAALGQLVLDGRQFSLFTFASPNGSKAALYVDYLFLTNNATDVSGALNIAPDFTLYFADASVPPDQLDGQLGGRIRWVKDYAGARSGTSVTLASGRTVFMNRALVSSGVVDSDFDGVPNALDSAPFEPSALRIGVRLLESPSRSAEVTWAGTPGGRYRVEYSDALDDSDWQPLTTVQHTREVPGTVSVVDSSVPEAQPRFYRVVVDQ